MNADKHGLKLPSRPFLTEHPRPSVFIRGSSSSTSNQIVSTRRSLWQPSENPFTARIKPAADFKDFLSLCLCHRAPLFLICSLAIPFLTSCVTKPSGSDACLCHDYFATKQARQQGVSDAKRNIRDKGFRILRYDLSPVRTGGWYEHMLYFHHFGIEEADEWFASIDYCQGYNDEMDRQLSKRYGAEYRRFRDKILPKPGAKRYTGSR